MKDLDENVVHNLHTCETKTLSSKCHAPPMSLFSLMTMFIYGHYAQKLPEAWFG
jgi:hypothetical protein